MKKLEKAWKMLLELTDRGMEYPEAEWKVIENFKLSNQQIVRLRNYYDSDRKEGIV